MAADEEPVRVLAWDSDFFGVRVGRLAAGLGPGAFAAAVAGARERGFDCLHQLSDAGDLETSGLAEEHGFRLVDVRLEYAIDLASRASARAAAPAGRPPSVASAAVRPARPGDVPALRAIAAQSHRATRFRADGGFDGERCDELYATWIEKSCAGWADAVLVADHDGAPAGYASCHRRED